MCKEGGVVIGSPTQNQAVEVSSAERFVEGAPFRRGRTLWRRIWWSGSGGGGWWSMCEVRAAVWCSHTKTKLCSSVLADNWPAVVYFFEEGGSPGVGVHCERVDIGG